MEASPQRQPCCSVRTGTDRKPSSTSIGRLSISSVLDIVRLLLLGAVVYVIVLGTLTGCKADVKPVVRTEAEVKVVDASSPVRIEGAGNQVTQTDSFVNRTMAVSLAASLLSLIAAYPLGRAIRLWREGRQSCPVIVGTVGEPTMGFAANAGIIHEGDDDD